MSERPNQLEPGIVLLCGRSFSGKSTLAAALAAELQAQVVSLDQINAERGLSSGSGVSIDTGPGRTPSRTSAPPPGSQPVAR